MRRCVNRASRASTPRLTHPLGGQHPARGRHRRRHPFTAEPLDKLDCRPTSAPIRDCIRRALRRPRCSHDGSRSASSQSSNIHRTMIRCGVKVTRIPSTAESTRLRLVPAKLPIVWSSQLGTTCGRSCFARASSASKRRCVPVAAAVARHDQRPHSLRARQSRVLPYPVVSCSQPSSASQTAARSRAPLCGAPSSARVGVRRVPGAPSHSAQRTKHVVERRES